MKREVHKATVRAKIMSVARKLFLAQGYQNTKMRQIKEAADVKIGTIYHFYKNKEDIFAHIVLEAFFRVLKRTSVLAEGDKLLHLACELSWHVNTMAQDAPSAELYLISYNSPRIAAELLINQTAHSKVLFSHHFPEMKEEEYKLFAMIVRGLMQTISLQAVSKTLDDPQFIIHKSVAIILKMMETPPADIEHVLQQLEALNIEQRVREALSGSANSSLLLAG